MSFIVNIDQNAGDVEFGGGSYPKSYHDYPATITDVKKETTSGGTDLVKTEFLVELPNGDTYEEKMNGLAFMYNEYLTKNIGILLQVVGRNNEGRFDKDLLTTKAPDLSKIVGLKVGVRYAPSYNNPKYSSVDRVIDLDKVDGCYDETAYQKWLENREKGKGTAKKPASVDTNKLPFE